MVRPIPFVRSTFVFLFSWGAVAAPPSEVCLEEWAERGAKYSAPVVFSVSADGLPTGRSLFPGSSGLSGFLEVSVEAGTLRIAHRYQGVGLPKEIIAVEGVWIDERGRPLENTDFLQPFSKSGLCGSIPLFPEQQSSAFVLRAPTVSNSNLRFQIRLFHLP
jgi:hypothetical protein